MKNLMVILLGIVGVCATASSFANVVWNVAEGADVNKWTGTWTQESGAFPGPVYFKADMTQKSTGNTNTYLLKAYIVGSQVIADREYSKDNVKCRYVGSVTDNYVTGTGICSDTSGDLGAPTWGAYISK